MDNSTYQGIFAAFEKAPMEDFMNGLFSSIPEEQRKELVLEDISYHRLSANVATLEAWMYIAPVESNHWIWVRVELDDATGDIQESFFTKGTYQKKPFPSLQACIDNYKK